MPEQVFPIEPPVPHNDILDTLRPTLAKLRAAAEKSPSDPRLIAAVSGIAGAIAVLELPPPHTNA